MSKSQLLDHLVGTGKKGGRITSSWDAMVPAGMVRVTVEKPSEVRQCLVAADVNSLE
jgi:hypothetical protein